MDVHTLRHSTGVLGNHSWEQPFHWRNHTWTARANSELSNQIKTDILYVYKNNVGGLKVTPPPRSQIRVLKLVQPYKHRESFSLPTPTPF